MALSTNLLSSRELSLKTIIVLIGDKQLQKLDCKRTKLISARKLCLIIIASVLQHCTELFTARAVNSEV